MDELDINETAANHFDGRILGHSTYFYGFAVHVFLNRVVRTLHVIVHRYLRFFILRR